MNSEIVSTPYSKHLKVYIQGDLEGRAATTVFLTVHDVGTNSKPYWDFVESSFMAEVKKRSVWLHVVLPGQDDGDDPLPSGFSFPSLDELAKDLGVVLDAFRIKGTVIGFGEGAGANILLRFGLLFPNRCLGLILIDTTASSAGFDEHVLCKMYNWKEDGMKLWRKVVAGVAGQKMAEKRLVQNEINAANVGVYLDAYLKRDDISAAVGRDLSVDTVLITGSYSPYSQDAYSLTHLNCKRTTVLIVDDKADVLIEAPMNLARALILFCKGVGVLTSVPLLGLEKEFQKVKEKCQPKKGDLEMMRTLRMYEDWVDFAP